MQITRRLVEEVATSSGDHEGLSFLFMILKRPTLVSVAVRSGICCLDGVAIRRCYR